MVRWKGILACKSGCPDLSNKEVGDLGRVASLLWASLSCVKWVAGSHILHPCLLSPVPTALSVSHCPLPQFTRKELKVVHPMVQIMDYKGDGSFKLKE